MGIKDTVQSSISKSHIISHFVIHSLGYIRLQDTLTNLSSIQTRTHLRRHGCDSSVRLWISPDDVESVYNQHVLLLFLVHQSVATKDTYPLSG